MRGGWGVWCVRLTTGKGLWYEIQTGVPYDLSEVDARKLAEKVNRAGRYRAEARRLPQP